MGKKSAGLLDSLRVRAAAKPPRNMIWFDKLPPGVQAELQEAKDAYVRGGFASQFGEMPLSRFATMLSAELAERKIATIGRQGIENWLKRK